MKLRTRKARDGTPTFYVDWRQDGQRRRQRLAGIHDRKTAEVAFAEFKVKFARGQASLPTDEGMTLATCLDAHLQAKTVNVVDRHVKNLTAYKAEAVKHFGPTLPVRLLSEKAVNKWREEMRRDGITPSTINRKTAFLKAAIARAVRAGKIAKNPLETLVALSDARRDVWRWLRDEEVAALLGVLRDGIETPVKRTNGHNYKTKLGRNQDMLRLTMFLLNTGARRGEALALRWADVDMGRKIVTLHTTKRAAMGRHAKPRHIPMNAALVEMFGGMERGAADEPVFTVSRNNLKRRFTRACKLAGIGHCRIHDLRHTFASHLVMAATPLNTVRELLGHTTMTMTLRYAHLAPEATAAAVQTLNFGASQTGARVIPVGVSAA